MGGSGTTVTQQRLPPQVEALLGESAETIRTAQNRAAGLASFIPQRQFGQPFGTAAADPLQNVASFNLRNARIAERPREANEARIQAIAAPRFAGETPSSAFTAVNEPRDVAQARQFAGRLPAGIGRPNDFLQAVNIAEQLRGPAQGVPGEFAGAAQQAQGLIAAGERVPFTLEGQPALQRGRPGEFGDIRSIVEQTPGQFTTQAQRAAALQGLAGERPGEFNQVRGIAGFLPGEFTQIPGQAGQLPGGFNRLEAIGTQVPGGFGQLQAIGGQVPRQFGRVRQQAAQGFQNIGGDITNAPAVQAARRAFEENILPSIQNQAALAGLGRSTSVGRAQAAAEAQFLLPVIQEELARQERAVRFGADVGLQEALAAERGLGRQLTAAESAALAQERGIGRQLAGAEAQATAAERALGRGVGGLETLATARERALGRQIETGLQAGTAGERALQRGVQAGQFGVETGLQEALARERALGRTGAALETAGGATERDIQRQQAAQEFVGLGQERGIQRGQTAGQFAVGAEQVVGAARERGIQRGQEAGQFAVGTRLGAGQAGERAQERTQAGLQAGGQQLQALAAQETARRQFLAEAQERAVAREADAVLGGGQLLADLGQQQRAAQIQENQLQQALGQTLQQRAQSRQDRITQDFLRRQALAEQAAFVPFGQVAPSAIGSQVAQSSGLFK